MSRKIHWKDWSGSDGQLDVRDAKEILEPAGKPPDRLPTGSKSSSGEGAVKLPEPKKPRPTKSPLPDVVPPVPPMR